ncbi:uncharacterized protein A4U43_C05F26100 [Asparagus officinalis]|uniref:Morc S5 domain-containing protein n=1 Tax=Asparagus officinalis TaxID=4686 RepID=A0A5P1EUK3_ASPOF|nr:protein MICRORCHIDIA 6-like [Asparagus officinalis]XP_020264838.1 protein MICRORCHIDIA 6-like [Asparagus officinalis]XP_020264839.1 protein MICRORCHIDIA 6-like [Asparagus officinalis]ONK69728.1 uncharacterized protein A4U43_C05F26100 [Asparagus officinalis]
MSFPEFIDISSDEEDEEMGVKDVKPILPSDTIQGNANCEVVHNQLDHEEFYVKQILQAQINSNEVNGISYGSYIADQERNPTDQLCLASSSPGSSVALCRQFWKSGDYKVGQTRAPVHQNGKNRLRIHPKFLHSNATSHKWAFGAIAELLDNAIDEVQNGATFVIIDRFTNPRNGEAALLIHDDGGGMDPESLRRCMSFGFSDKQSDATIGQYGNGFKTSTMRLGADVIVFSRCSNKRMLTQSVGLLSYTFLRQTGSDDIVVPVVDYEFNPSTGAFESKLRTDENQFSTNLSTLLRWSPFVSESELLEQFSDIGHHGTKVIVFNLWYSDDGDMELDFQSDPKDILINKTQKNMNRVHELTKKNVATRLQYSLRAYSSILYLRVPETFKIILRGEVVMQHHVVNDLIYLECVMYRPQVEGYPEVLTTIGFEDGAPNVDVQGFNVYHKNRLILPFWKVTNNSYGKGRGVVGVLEANFVKPTHDKQDFEKSSIYQKLENRLKEMTYEYWDLHCHLLGYKPVKRAIHHMGSIAETRLRISKSARRFSDPGTSHIPVVKDPGVPSGRTQQQLTIYNPQDQTGLPQKRKLEREISVSRLLRRQALQDVFTRRATGTGDGHETQLEQSAEQKRRREIKNMMQVNKNLREQCLEFEQREKELLIKEEKLRRELRSFQQLHKKLSTELNALAEVKEEKL